jgi:hypothetical protein
MNRYKHYTSAIITDKVGDPVGVAAIEHDGDFRPPSGSSPSLPYADVYNIYRRRLMRGQGLREKISPDLILDGFSEASPTDLITALNDKVSRESNYEWEVMPLEQGEISAISAEAAADLAFYTWTTDRRRRLASHI